MAFPFKCGIPFMKDFPSIRDFLYEVFSSEGQPRQGVGDVCVRTVGFAYEECAQTHSCGAFLRVFMLAPVVPKCARGNQAAPSASAVAIEARSTCETCFLE